MFSRSVLRGLALRRAVATPPTISQPISQLSVRTARQPLQRFISGQTLGSSRPALRASFPISRQPSPILSRFKSSQPWGRFPPSGPRKPYTRWNEEDLRRAKPLLTSEKIAYILTHRFTHILLVIAAGGGVVFYFSNIEEVPVTGRRRFNCFSEESVEAESLMMYKMIMDDARNNGSLVPRWDPRAVMVERVMRKLIPASGLEDADWEVNVLESRETNAFVLPGGKVFVYTGILPIAKTDDGLAAILGHEIAHNVARHSAESMSRDVIITWPLRLLFITLDSIGATGGVGRVLFDLIIGPLGISRPASRKQESEADYIGLMIMAKSCYDPKEAVGVWERMEALDQKQGAIPEWYSTHPSNANRIEKMTSWLPKADDARSESGCAVTLGYSEAFNKAIHDSGNIWSLLR